MVIVNNFDINSMKLAIMDLLSVSIMRGKNKGNDVVMKRIRTLCFFLLLGGILCIVYISWLTAYVFKGDSFSTTREYLCLAGCLLVGAYGTYHFSIVLLRNNQIDHENKIQIYQLVNKAETLDDIHKIIQIIQQEFTSYKISDCVLPHNIHSLTLLEENIQSYLALTRYRIINWKIEKNIATFNLQVDDENIQSLEVISDIELDGHVMQNTLIFSTWNRPYLIVKGQTNYNNIP